MRHYCRICLLERKLMEMYRVTTNKNHPIMIHLGNLYVVEYPAEGPKITKEEMQNNRKAADQRRAMKKKQQQDDMLEVEDSDNTRPTEAV